MAKVQVVDRMVVLLVQVSCTTTHLNSMAAHGANRVAQMAAVRETHYLTGLTNMNNDGCPQLFF